MGEIIMHCKSLLTFRLLKENISMNIDSQISDILVNIQVHISFLLLWIVLIYVYRCRGCI